MKERIAMTTLPDGKRVSTVLLPFPHRGGQYETTVSPPDSWRGLDTDRYDTLEEAEAGHERMVAKWRDAPRTEARP